MLTALPATASAEESPLFPTRESAFEIPFQIAAPTPGQEPVEVQLHVSENRGGSWSQYAKVAPTEGRFAFRASHDGEYWFLVRTLSRSGKLLPDESFAPELRVMIDTLPPAVKLQIESPQPDKIRCTYSVADSLLKVETLEIVCRGVDASNVVKPTSIVPVATSRPAAEAAGTALFDVAPSLRGPLFVRVSVADGAGNVAVEERQVEAANLAGLNPNALPSTASPQPLAAASGGTATPSTGGAPPSGPNQFSSSPWRQSLLPAQRNPLIPSETIGPPPTADGARGSPPSLARSFPGSENIPKPEVLPSAGPAAGAVVENVPPGQAAGQFAPASKPQTLGPYMAGRPDSGPVESIGPGEVESLPVPTAAPTTIPSSAPSGAVAAESGPAFGSADGGVPPAVNRSQAAERPLQAPKSLAAPEGDDAGPAGVRPRLVNSKRFELDYDIESVGTAGVARVELFGTRDGGKTWNSLGDDPDSTSPFVVNVDGEGTYGFRMVIESTNGLKSPTPEPGDLPEVWVGVDVTKPTAAVVSAKPGFGEHAGELEIRWEAADANLTTRPIALAYATEASGPWTIIASGLPNQGHYTWRLDSRTPGKLYLKVEARDEAGNVGTFITPEPVAIERVRPQGRIRGVRPIGESASLRMPAALPRR